MNTSIRIGIILGILGIVTCPNRSDMLLGRGPGMDSRGRALAEIALVSVNGAVAVEPASKPATQPAAATKPKVYTKKISEDELVADFGVKSGDAVPSGFVFLDGRYIDAPYVVSRRGLSVYINGQRVYRVPLLEREPPSGDIDPELPREINPDTSQYEEVFLTYIREKIAYVQKHHTPEEEQKIMEQVYRNLPFVKNSN